MYGRLTESDAVPGVIDPSLWVGYVWADQPRNSATVVVTGTEAKNVSHDGEFDVTLGDGASISNRLGPLRCCAPE